jgi:hypothetical protein
MSLNISIIDLIFGIAARAMRAEELLESARGQTEALREHYFQTERQRVERIAELETELAAAREAARSLRALALLQSPGSLAELPSYCERLPDDELGPVVRTLTYPKTRIEINDPHGAELYITQEDADTITLNLSVLRAYLALVPVRGDSPA